jgi:hypothetical protein
MSRKDIVNAVLVIAAGALAILAARGGVQATSWISDLLLNAGAGLLGGALVRITLFAGVGHGQASSMANSLFKEFKRNQDLGTGFWIDFISGIGTDAEPLWFVGRRHLLWIDKGHDYRRVVADGLKARLRRFADGSGQDGSVTIVVSDANAFEVWRDFLSTEIVPISDAAAKRLIRLGRLDEGVIPYSAVAHGRRVVVTTLLSTGRAADSPTFLVEATSDIGELYRVDMKAIAQRVSTNRWWTP